MIREHPADKILMRHLATLEGVQSAALGPDGAYVSFVVTGTMDHLPDHAKRLSARYGLTLACRETGHYGSGVESIFEIMTEERLQEVRQMIATADHQEITILATPDGAASPEAGADGLIPDGGVEGNIEHLGELAEISAVELDGTARLALSDGERGVAITVPEEWIEPLRRTADEIEEIHNDDGGSAVKLVPDGGDPIPENVDGDELADEIQNLNREDVRICEGCGDVERISSEELDVDGPTEDLHQLGSLLEDYDGELWTIVLESFADVRAGHPHAGPTQEFVAAQLHAAKPSTSTIGKAQRFVDSFVRAYAIENVADLDRLQANANAERSRYCHGIQEEERRTEEIAEDEREYFGTHAGLADEIEEWQSDQDDDGEARGS